MKRLILSLILAIGIFPFSLFSKSMVILDPGHPTRLGDLGTTRDSYGEATETLKIAEAVMDLLELEPDIDGTLTRGTYTYDPNTCPISKRVSFTRNAINKGSLTYDTFIFLSIHLNGDASAKGIETFYYTNSSVATETHEFSFYVQYRQIEAKGMEHDRTIRDGTIYQKDRMYLLKPLPVAPQNHIILPYLR